MEQGRGLGSEVRQDDPDLVKMKQRIMTYKANQSGRNRVIGYLQKKHSGGVDRNVALQDALRHFRKA